LRLSLRLITKCAAFCCSCLAFYSRVGFYVFFFRPAEVQFEALVTHSAELQFEALNISFLNINSVCTSIKVVVIDVVRGHIGLLKAYCMLLKVIYRMQSTFIA
jgi:hypothetical protein